MPAAYTSVSTAAQIPPPSPHNFNPLYVVAAEDRAESVEEERSKVEGLRIFLQRFRREYSAMTNGISQSRTRFNAGAYISRLPREILATIFETYVADRWEANYPLDSELEMDGCDGSPYYWIKIVLHVCRQWRSVALSTPRLWTIIAHNRIYEPWRLEFLLKHAGSLPLTLRNDKILVKWSSDDDEYDRMIYDQDTRGLALFLDVLRKFAQLETVSLIVTRKMGQFLTTLKGEDDSEDIIALSMRYLRLDLSHYTSKATPLFINVNMPHLQSLSLLEGRLELVQRLSCSSLTHLDVSFCDSVLMSEFLDILEGTPGLRQLLAADIYLDEGDAIPQRAVPLLSLERLRINGPICTSGQLLNQLVFPIDTLIELYTNDNLTFSLLSPLMPAILGCTASDANLSRTSPHTLHVSNHDLECIYMTTSVWFGGTATPPLVPDTSQTRAALVDQLQAGEPRLNLVCPRETYRLDMLETTDVLSLHFECQLGNGWDELFRRSAFLKLETLRIDDFVAREILQGLIRLVEETQQITMNTAESVRSPCTRPPLPLPSLKTLTLHHSWSSFNKEGKPTSADDAQLVSLLRRCAQLGYRLRLLRLTGSICAAVVVQDALFKLGIADAVEISSSSSLGV